MADFGLITLELFDGSAEQQEAAKTGRSRAVGHFRIENGPLCQAVVRHPPVSNY